MYLKSINLINFRRIKNAKCSFNQGLNLIVGPNDSGKTAVIDAIRFTLRQVVDDYSRISVDDFNDPNHEIMINITFSFEDCSGERQLKELAAFAEYLSFTSANKPELNIWFTIKNSENDLKFPEFRVGPTKDVSVDMDSRCRENLKVVYLRPLRDAENELRAKQGSRISKILSSHKDITAAQTELVALLGAFKKESEKFFDEGKGLPVAEEIRRLLTIFDEQVTKTKKEIKFGPTEKLDSLRTLEKIALYYQGLPRPGLGTLNMIFIAAELLHLNTQTFPKLILIEEIEAHLHPQRQLKIIKALQDESMKGIQMILSTHSPNLASVIDVSRLNVCYEGQFYSLSKGNTELSDNDYDYLGRFLDVTKANLFFTQGVILAEGPTEQLLIPEFAKVLGYDLTNYGISVISTNNLGFEYFVNIFKRKEAPFNQIPVAVITDADDRNTIRVTEFIAQIKDDNNAINCFIGKQLYLDTDLAADTNKRTTFEKLIFDTIELKKLYIDAYNSLKGRSVPASAEMHGEQLYEKMKREKAPIAQIVAQQLSILANPRKAIIKNEIETKLKYISDAIAFLIPKQTDAPAGSMPPATE